MEGTDGSRVIEYNNMQTYKKIPTHLMMNLRWTEGRMWKRSDGMLQLSIIGKGRNKLLIIGWRSTWTCLVGI